MCTGGRLLPTPTTTAAERGITWTAENDATADHRLLMEPTAHGQSHGRTRLRKCDAGTNRRCARHSMEIEMTATTHPSADRAARLEELRAVLRPMDTAEMSTPEVAEAYLAAVPDATIDEIVQALRQTAGELTTDADMIASAGRAS